ncbi:MAG TPA: DMT family transporter [Rubellimicrobium sp.]|nr:DMT family transporter [Rubellimicrobium sp.]
MTGRPLLLAVLLGCGLAWGSTQSLGKIAVSTGYGPFGLLFWQFVLGAALTGGLLLGRGRAVPVTGLRLALGAAIALVGSVIPGTTFYLSVERLPAGVMSILISAVPLLAFPMALALGQDRLSAGRALGLLCGVGGVALIAGPSSSLPEAGQAAFLPLALVGPLFYAIESNLVARWGLLGMDPLQVMLMASLCGAVLVLPLTLGSGQWIDPVRPWGPAEWAFVAGAAVNVLTYAAYVWLAARAGSTFASQSSYIVTASGLVWAMALLGESFPPTIWAALALMFAGLALVSPRERRPRPERT